MFKLFTRKGSPTSDEQLWQLYRKEGDMQALGELYERYVELVYGVCLKYLQNESDAQDAVMQVFEELVEKAKHHEVQQFKGWLYVCTKNHCLMRLRKEGKNIFVSMDPVFMQSDENKHLSDEAWLHDKEAMLNGMHHCLESLPAPQKQCIELFYLQGKSYKEIAALNREEVGKIRSNIQNGRRNLKLCMEKSHEAETI